VSRIHIGRANAGRDIERAVIWNAHHLAHQPRNIFRGVQWFDGFPTMATQELRVLFLDVRRVHQHDSAEIAGRGSGPHSARVSALCEQGQPAGVIDMRVRQHD